MRVNDGGRHVFRSFIAGVTEHHALISGALIRTAYPHADIFRLFVNSNDHFGIFSGKSDPRLVVTDIFDRIQSHLLPVDFGIGGDLSGNYDQIGRSQGFACHSAARVLHQTGIQYRIGYPVANFIRMSF